MAGKALNMGQKQVQRGRWPIAACFFANGLIVGSWVPQIPLLVQRFDLRESALGMLILILGLGAVLAMPLCGWLMGRFDSRFIVRIVSIIAAFVLLLIALAPSLV